MEKRKCWICGKEATVFPLYDRLSFEYRDRDSYQRGYCETCAKEKAKSDKEKKAEYIRLKKELMFERAIKLMEHQKQIDIYDYEEAIKAVQDFNLENLDKFDSADEIIAAIVLINNRISVNVQKKIGKYTVDFYIPKLEIILEVDGHEHAKRTYYDNERDKELRRILGGDWEIVRIKTEYLEQNAKELVTAMKAIKEEKQKLRAQNNGLLPDWYSRREFAKKPKKDVYGDELLLD